MQLQNTPVEHKHCKNIAGYMQHYYELHIIIVVCIKWKCHDNLFCSIPTVSSKYIYMKSIKYKKVTNENSPFFCTYCCHLSYIRELTGQQLNY